MLIITDDVVFANRILGPEINWDPIDGAELPQEILPLTNHLFRNNLFSVQEHHYHPLWDYLHLLKFTPTSQFEILRNLSGANRLAAKNILCLAGSGENFIGYKKRSWVSVDGNLHLSVHFSPQRKIAQFDVGFTILAAVSVIQTIDAMSGFKDRSFIRWVNDITIGNAKVGGVLASTQIQGQRIMSAIVGIGINISVIPAVLTDRFVPAVTSLKSIGTDPKDINEQVIFDQLSGTLANNYQLLLGGRYDDLFDFYLSRSVIINREVAVYSDPPDGKSELLAKGKVIAIDKKLELHIAGLRQSVRTGRLVQLD